MLLRLDSSQLLVLLEFCYISSLSAAAAPRFASICYVLRGVLFCCVCLLMSVCCLCVRAAYVIDFCGVKLARKLTVIELTCIIVIFVVFLDNINIAFFSN